MFESHFGFKASPFQLNPDPGFYFASKGHGQALAYLKYGVYQGEGFIVVTGEIGSGKTTLIQTLLKEVDPKAVVFAQVVNTQLDSGELLQAICNAFGVPVAGVSKAQLLAALEAFLTALAASGRRALLIVDEAQNLGVREIEELRMLSNLQLAQHALLQSFLVGQPELRQMIRSTGMEQLRQRVIASCHLGPLSQAETRSYVEHRLSLVGWTATNPSIDDDAFASIHAHSAGIPRRINLLCTRILLAAWLGDLARIDQSVVDTAAKELRVESYGEEVTAQPPTLVARLAPADVSAKKTS